MALTIYRGDDVRLSGTVLDQDGAAVNITGWTLVFSAAPEKGATRTFQVTATHVVSASGTFYFDLTPTQTATVCKLYYDVQATTNGSKIHTLDSSTIEFIQEVTVS